MTFRLRDVFWLIFVIALVCTFWRMRVHTQRLSMEARYYRSAAPPLEIIDMPMPELLAQLEASHGVKIEVDWPSVTEATGLDLNSKVTQNLVDASLPWVVERVFYNLVVIEGTDQGIRLRGRDPKRDGPPKSGWETRRQIFKRRSTP
ncbi:hypothetical protein [Anatilimnocola floriformis]|uniref:hypothetical protein n=1 Tax=Anatilimnocola floriformis TaxID=2948575 RepID=UPI0020C2E818|nr:hypothetical protein [Anatilimnocola floriformis]